MKIMTKWIVTLCLVILYYSHYSYAQSNITANTVKYKGINIYGAEFKGGYKNAKHFKDYIWPTNKNLDQMKSFGFNTIRVPFAWERMQPMNFNPLNPEQTKELDRIVQKAHVLGLYVVIDPHNYGQYKGKVLQANKLDLDTFADLWKRLASRYGSYPNVIFGLMNEPHKQSAKNWAAFAQVGVDAIRNTGAEQLILIPGTRWSGMHSWLSGGENSNANVLIDLTDPLDNYAYEMHQYFDADSSGTHHGLDYQCISQDQVKAKFDRATNWLKQHHKKAFLGEFGVQQNESCIAALKTSLEYMQSNAQNWIGWTYWGFSNWTPNYPYNIFLNTDNLKLRLKVINQYLFR